MSVGISLERLREASQSYLNNSFELVLCLMTAVSCPQVGHLDVRKEILRQCFSCCSETFQSVTLAITRNETLFGCAPACFAPVNCQPDAVR